MDASVQDLVAKLSNGQADMTEAQNFYDDVVGNLATYPILTNFNFLQSSAANPSGVLLSPNAVELVTVFWNDVGRGYIQLGELSIQEAAWLYPDIRDNVGRPVNFVRQIANQRQLLLLPNPSTHTPADVVALVSETRQTLPQYLHLPVALYILAKEYERESDHTDLELSAACQMLADFLMQIVVKK